MEIQTHVAREILRSIGSIPSVVILSQDSFYKRHDDDELKRAFANMYDFDHPDAIDMPLFASVRVDLLLLMQVLTEAQVSSRTEGMRANSCSRLFFQRTSEVV